MRAIWRAARSDRRCLELGLCALVATVTLALLVLGVVRNDQTVIVGAVLIDSIVSVRGFFLGAQIITRPWDVR